MPLSLGLARIFALAQACLVLSDTKHQRYALMRNVTIQASIDIPASDGSPQSKTVDPEECYSSVNSYKLAEYAWDNEYSPTSLVESEDERAYVQPIVKGILYTASDGIPRLSAYYTTMGSITTVVTQRITQTSTDNPPVAYPSPAPDCTIAQSDCNRLWTSYFSTVDDAFLMFSRGYYYGERTSTAPPCNAPSDPPACHMWADQVAVLYWPDTPAGSNTGVSITRRSLGERRTVTTDAVTLLSKRVAANLERLGGGVPGTVQNVLTGPFTLTSPTMYLAYAKLSTAVNGISYDGIVPVEAGDLYTWVPKWKKFEGDDAGFVQAMARGGFLDLHGYPNGWESRTYDPRDLKNPVPAKSFYAAARECWDYGLCATITDDTYHPTIMLKPRALAAVNPALSTCVHWRQGFDDPGIAITVVESLDVPVATVYPSLAQPLTQAALPKNTALNPWAMPTRKAQILGGPFENRILASPSVSLATKPDHTGSPKNVAPVSNQARFGFDGKLRGNPFMPTPVSELKEVLGKKYPMSSQENDQPARDEINANEGSFSRLRADVAVESTLPTQQALDTKAGSPLESTYPLLYRASSSRHLPALCYAVSMCFTTTLFNL